MQFDEAFFVAVSFVIFVLLVARPLGGLIARGLDNRADGIKKELDEAIQLKEEAQALLASYQRKHKRAVDEAEEIVSHAKQEAKRLIEETKGKLEDELAIRTKLAEQKIAQAEARVIQEIRDNAVEITINAARTLIMENLSSEVADELLEVAIANADRTFH